MFSISRRYLASSPSSRKDRQKTPQPRTSLISPLCNLYEAHFNTFLGNDNRSVERLHPAHGVQVDEIPDGELAGLHQVVRHR